MSRQTVVCSSMVRTSFSPSSCRPRRQGIPDPSSQRYINFQHTIKIFSTNAGLDASLFSSHSIRWGGCTFLAMCGASVEELKIRGEWSSDTVYEYLKTPLGARIVSDIKVASTLANYPLDVGLGGV